MITFNAHHVCIKVEDIEISKAFYEKTLGFTEASMIHHTPTVTSCFMRSSDGALELQLLSYPGCVAEHTGYGHLGMKVDDINESFKFHDGLGIVSQLIIEQPHQFGYFIKDPDGYETELCQLR